MTQEEVREEVIPFSSGHLQPPPPAVIVTPASSGNNGIKSSESAESGVTLSKVEVRPILEGGHDSNGVSEAKKAKFD